MIAPFAVYEQNGGVDKVKVRQRVLEQAGQAPGQAHEEIAQMIGTSRETVTRLFADLKKRQIVQAKGSTLIIRNKVALKAMATNS